MTVLPLSEHRIPAFEGRVVDAVTMRISGAASVDEAGDRIVSVDDTVHLSGEYRVIAVRHFVDEKSGNLVREHVLRPVAVMITPWDGNDPSDDGVVRSIR